MQAGNPDDAFSPLGHVAALVGEIHEDDVLVLQLLLERLHCLDALPAWAAPCGPKVEEDHLAGMLRDNGFEELRARHFGRLLYAVFCLQTHALELHAVAVDELLQDALEVGMHHPYRVFGHHLAFAYGIAHPACFRQSFRHLVRLRFRHAVCLEIRQELGREREPEAETVAKELEVAGVRIDKRVSAFQVPERAVGVLNTFLEGNHIDTSYTSTHIAPLDEKRQEVPLSAGIVLALQHALLQGVKVLPQLVAPLGKVLHVFLPAAKS